MSAATMETPLPSELTIDVGDHYRKKVDERYCEKIARVFSKNTGIKVNFGTGCYTDTTSTITLPKMYAERWIVDGELDHEWLHVLRNEKALKNAIKRKSATWEACAKRADELKKSNPEKYGILPMWLNVLEDVSIETEGMKRWAGVHVNLTRTRFFMIEKLEAEPKPPEFADAVGKAFIAEALSPSLRESKNEILQAGAAFVIEHLSDFIPRAKESRWTDDTLDLAIELCDRLEEMGDEAEEARKAADEAEGDLVITIGGDGEGEGEEGEGGSAAGVEASEGKEGEAASGGKAIKLTKEEAENLAGLIKALKAASGSDGETGTFHKETKRIAEEETRGVYSTHPIALQNDRIVRAPKNVARFRVRDEKAKKIVGALASRLRLVLLSTDHSTDYGLRHGKIDRTKLARLARFNTKVFKRDDKREIGYADTAVGILIDESGSMSGDMDDTIAAVVALSRALNQIGIKFEINGFTNVYSGTPPSRDGYDRTLPFRFNVYKAFGESWETEKTRLGSAQADCENGDGEAVEWAAKRLLHRPEARKVLFVLSDGSPICGPDTKQQQHLKRITGWIDNHKGVEVIAIGLRYSGITNYYKNAVTVDDLSQLPGVLFRKLRRALGR